MFLNIFVISVMLTSAYNDVLVHSLFVFSPCFMCTVSDNDFSWCASPSHFIVCDAHIILTIFSRL